MLHDFEVGDRVVWNSRDKEAKRKLLCFDLDRKHYGAGPFRVVGVRPALGLLLLTARQVVKIETKDGPREFMGLAFRPTPKEKK